jgi:hypothetical protein
MWRSVIVALSPLSPCCCHAVTMLLLLCIVSDACCLVLPQVLVAMVISLIRFHGDDESAEEMFFANFTKMPSLHQSVRAKFSGGLIPYQFGTSDERVRYPTDLLRSYRRIGLD